ncbi:PKD domain-containing protein [Pedobacter polaris]|uniref:PKD domain-containing protein n=1 Tax=Pedobacter polaris TaxID=2571273 RepID=A0A4U1CPB1_9SPHI|nr:PKD domain-containing protein [Pedobacter polaris]TKC09891.1 PKD domain-containing protein [Pedobacter polaris]
MKLKFLPVIVLILFVLGCKKDELSKELKPNFSVVSQQILAGESVVFSDLSEGQASSWSWEFEGGTPAVSELSGPTVTYNQPGTYAVSLTVKNSATTAVEKKTAYITVSYRDITADFTVATTSIKQNESITFTDKSLGMPTQWAWEFKSGATVLTSTSQNPSMIFTVPGVYTVTLTATNPKGAQTVTKTNLLTVVDITSVEANFDSDQTATYTGGSIKFNDKSIGTATAWAWTFEGASVGSSTVQNPTVSYASPGRYKVKLVASNTVKTSTIEKTAYILVVPGGSLTAFYPLNGSINDAGPSKLVSTPVGTVGFEADRTAAEGRTGIFGSTGGFIVPDNEAMNFGTGDYSVSVWVKTSTTTRGMIWQESGAKGSKDNQTWVRILNSATQVTSFSTEDEINGSSIHLNNANDGAVASMNDGAWHHIVTTRKGTLTAIYIDGVKIKEATASGIKNVSNQSPFKVGLQEGTGGYNNQYNGLMDDLIIYKKALTQAEVTALKNL